MDFGKIATSLFGTLLIFMCLMASVYYLIPLYQKIQLDQLCREYSYMVNGNEGMNFEMRQNLELELENLGLEEIQIQCPDSGALKRRERRAFTVTGIIHYREVVGFLDIREAKGSYEFTGWVYGKRIVN